MQNLDPVLEEYFKHRKSVTDANAPKRPDGHTIYGLRLFNRWLSEAKFDPIKIAPDELAGFKAWLAGRDSVIKISRAVKLTKVTQAAVLGVIRGLYRWLHEASRVASDMSEPLKLVVNASEMVGREKFTVEEVQTLLKVQIELTRIEPALSPQFTRRFRDLVAICLGVATGASFDALMNLSVGDLDLSAKVVRLQGKAYALPPWSLPILREYIDKARISPGGEVYRSPWLFVGAHTVKMNKGALKNAVKELRDVTVKRYPQLSGLAHRYMMFKFMQLPPDAVLELPKAKAPRGIRHTFSMSELLAIQLYE